MVNNKVLILGGSGFIGKNLSKYLLKKDYEITSTYFKKKYEISKKIKYVQVNLKKPKEIKDKIRNNKFDFIINCAGYINHTNDFNKKNNAFNEHVEIAHSVINHFKNKEIIRYINFGTSDEYGDSLSPQSEKQKNKPETLYALSKTYTNLLLKKFWQKYKFPFVTLRLFLVYGPGQRKERLIPYIIKNSIKNKEYNIFGGNQIKDFCYIDDLCEAVTLSLKNNNVNGQTINIASGKKTTIKKIVKIIQLYIKKGNPRFQKKIYRKSENVKLWADIKKAHKILGWKAKTSISEGLRKTVNSYL